MKNTILSILLFVSVLCGQTYPQFQNWKVYPDFIPSGSNYYIPTEDLVLLYLPYADLGLAEGNEEPDFLTYGPELITNGDFHDFTMEDDANTLGHYIFDKTYETEDGITYIGSERSGTETPLTVTLINNGSYPWDTYSNVGGAVVATETTSRAVVSATLGSMTIGRKYRILISNATFVGDYISVRTDITSSTLSNAVEWTNYITRTGEDIELVFTATATTVYVGVRRESFAAEDASISFDSFNVYALPVNSTSSSGFSEFFASEYLAAGELSSELMTFATYLTDQIPYGTNTFTVDSGVGTLTFVDNEAGTYSNLDAGGGMAYTLKGKVGETFKFVAEVKSSWASSTLDIYNGTAYTSTLIGSDWSEVTVNITITGAGTPLIRLRFNGTPTAGSTIQIRALSVKLVGDSNPAYQNGGTLKFDGVNDYFVGGNIHDITTGDFSIEAWIRTVSSPSAAEVICGKAPNAQARYHFNVTTGGVVNAFVRDAVPNSGSISSTATVNDGEWHHVAFVFDRDVGAYIYIDGVVDASEETTEWTTLGSLTGTGDFQIGAFGGALNLFDGYIAEVRVSDKVRTATEINMSYGLGRGWTTIATIANGSFSNYNGTFKQFHNRTGGSGMLPYQAVTLEDGALYKLTYTASNPADGATSIGAALMHIGFGATYINAGGDVGTAGTYYGYGKSGTTTGAVRFSTTSSDSWVVDDVSLKKVTNPTQPTYSKDFIKDRSKTSTYTDVVTNGNFETGDDTGWTLTDTPDCDVQNTVARSGYALRMDFTNDGTYPTASTTVAGVNKQLYKMSWWMRSTIATLTSTFYLGNNAESIGCTQANTWEYFERYYVANGTSNLFRVQVNNANHTKYFDDIKIEKVTGAYDGVMLGSMEDNQINHPYGFYHDGVDDLASMGQVNIGTDDFMWIGWIWGDLDPAAYTTFFQQYESSGDYVVYRMLGDEAYFYYKISAIATSIYTVGLNPMDNLDGWNLVGILVKRGQDVEFLVNETWYTSNSTPTTSPSTDAFTFDAPFVVGPQVAATAYRTGVSALYQGDLNVTKMKLVAAEIYQKTMSLYTDQ